MLHGREGQLNKWPARHFSGRYLWSRTAQVTAELAFSDASLTPPEVMGVFLTYPAITSTPVHNRFWCLIRNFFGSFRSFLDKAGGHLQVLLLVLPVPLVMWIRSMEHCSSNCDINRQCETAYALEKVLIEAVTTWQKAEKSPHRTRTTWQKGVNSYWALICSCAEWILLVHNEQSFLLQMLNATFHFIVAFQASWWPHYVSLTWSASCAFPSSDQFLFQQK